MSRILLAALLLGLLTLAATRQRPVHAAFAVLHFMPAEEDLKQARADGINLVILQYSRGTNEPADLNGVREFIRRCENARMPYMLGLHYHEPWEKEWLCGRDITAHVRTNLDLLDQLEPLTTGRFRGWYMPLEAGNHRGADYTKLAAAFAAFENASDAPMAMAVYFNPHSDFAGASEFARNVAAIAAPFDIVLLQDSVGERSIVDFDRELVPYYREVKAAVTAGRHRQFWAIVEGFQCDAPLPDRQCDARSAAKPDRICRQVATARQFTRRMVAYDLIEFLQPRGTGPKNDAYRAYVHGCPHDS